MNFADSTGAKYCHVHIQSKLRNELRDTVAEWRVDIAIVNNGIITFAGSIPGLEERLSTAFL
jgi:hypothetical protein